MSEQSLKEKTAKGLFWGGLSNGLQQALGALIGIVLLVYLTPEDYGLVALLAIFMAVANTIQESGFTTALVNRVEFRDEDYNAVFWFNLLVGIGLYFILFFSAPLIASFFNQPELTVVARMLFLSITIGSLSIAHHAVLFKKVMAKERAKADIFSTLLSGVIGIFLAMNGWGYWALVFQTLTYASMKTILYWFFSPWRPSLNINFKPVKEMFGFSAKLLASTVLAHAQNNIFSVLLGRFDTTTHVGHYSQGMKWAGMGTQVITGMVISVAQPIFVEVKNDMTRQAQIFRKMLRFTAFISFPFLFGIAFVGRDFMLLINEEWLPCVPVLQMYCIWGAFAGIQYLYMQLAISHGKSLFYFIYTIAYATVQIGSALIALPYGLYWMAFAVNIVSFIFLFVWHLYVRKLIPIPFFSVIKDIIPYFLTTIFIFLTTYLITKKIEITWLRFFCKIMLSVIAYCFIMWKSNSIIFKESLSLILKKRSNDY
ncbi:lipopolysaccharide biosynthesis protein [Parabacteroides sp. PF5-9]|uniref:lipopolysaccharide biosynthesis protein n=1 Tax=Parabacteroides sp. PF5-9 TaxID=1742404 RepID=UPI002476E630|nr:lipopolysaccharide biosynthesis protein [Parabacteroides sp. PF5-9]MDH6358704.1 O-antigen/teichoic acid export membrane protein [Parabacteroides sp. PF5-9]